MWPIGFKLIYRFMFYVNELNYYEKNAFLKASGQESWAHKNFCFKIT